MVAKQIHEKLTSEGFEKTKPYNSYSVDDTYGWYEKMVPLSEQRGISGVMDTIDIGIAVGKDLVISVYMTAHCVVGCCGELTYQGKFDYERIEHEIQKMDEYWSND